MIEQLLKQLDLCQMQIESLIVKCDRPGPGDVDRLRIWEGAQIPDEFALLDLAQIFDRLKPFAVTRPSEQNWFQYVRWILWSSESVGIQ